MTERKPMGITFDSWVDRQIDASIKRGEFENLPGKGKPLSGVNGRYDPDWWLREKLARENLDITPDTIVARRKAEVFMARYLDLGSVGAVTREASRLNALIAAANQTDLGPHLPQPLLDIEALVSAWSEARSRR